MPRVYIVILNYKRWQDVKDCLYSVLHSTYKNFKIIVVDNDSQDNSLQQLIKWFGEEKTLSEKTGEQPMYKLLQAGEIGYDPDFDSFPVFLVQNNANTGFAAGNNLVIQSFLKHEAYVWLLNPDIVVKEDTLEELIKFASQNSSKSIIGSLIKSFSDRAKIVMYGGARINYNSATISLIKKEKDIEKIDFIYGGSLLTHTRHFREIGLLPEDYFLFWEEADWCYRANKKGYGMRMCPAAICYDKIGTSIGRGFLANYYYTRNGLLFLSKYKKGKVTIAVVFAILRVLIRILTGRWDRARGVLRGIINFFRKK
jgi:hypothetical protein